MKNKDISLEKKFKALLKEKDLTVRGFCNEIGMSTTNYYDVLRRNSIDTKYLKIIADKYEVPESYFVVEDQEVSYKVKRIINNEEDLKKNYLDKIDQLKKELEAKQKEVELLRELVDSKNQIIEGLKRAN